MPNRGYFLYLFLFLLGIPFIYAEHSPKYGICNPKNEDKYVCSVYRENVRHPIPSYTMSRTCGKEGPMVFEDATYLRLMSAYVREKIPQRVVHAKGAGAHGYLEITHDITEYTKAAIFSKIGQKTSAFCRFSNGIGDNGSPDTSRSALGLACKFYTTDGNWDLVTLSLPIYYIKDPILFVSLSHATKRNPVTGRPDPNMVWDFVTKRQETLSAALIVYSDAGTPFGYRHMDAHAVSAFVFANKHNEYTYVKFNLKTQQGIKNFTAEEAEKTAGKDPDWNSKDLFDNIQEGNYPKWTLCVQLMSFEEAKRVHFNPLDPTVLWSEHEFPCRPVGRLVLNKNPKSYFAEVEQVRFSPGTLVEGIEPSSDRLLQGSLFPYDDAARYRLGINSDQLPINQPNGILCSRHNLDRGGFMNFDYQDEDDPNYYPNYYPNSFSTLHPDPKAGCRDYRTDGHVGRFDLGDEPNYEQARAIYESFTHSDQELLAQNIGKDIQNIKQSIKCKVLRMLKGVSEHLVSKIAHYAHTHNWQEECEDSRPYSHHSHY